MEKELVCTSSGGGVIIVIDGESCTVRSNESDRRNVKYGKKTVRRKAERGLWKKGGTLPKELAPKV